MRTLRNPKKYPKHEQVWCACLRDSIWLVSKNKGRRCYTCKRLGVPRAIDLPRP
jgi:hypothetical protein